MSRQRWIGVSLLAMMLMASCKPDTECRTENNVGMQVVAVLDSMQGDTLKVSFARFDSITVQGLGNDSVLYNNSKSVTTLFLPLRTDTTVTAYTLDAYGTQDTLFVKHSNNETFISLACGCFVYHCIEGVYHNGGLIDSIVVLNSSIENYKQDNVRLYISLTQ